MAKKTRVIPRFQSEADEAAWWEENRAKLDKDFLQRAANGELQRLDRTKLAARTAPPTRVVSIRLAEEDIAIARQQAAEKGLPYQTYIKSLLHEALRGTN